MNRITSSGNFDVELVRKTIQCQQLICNLNQWIMKLDFNIRLTNKKI